MHLPSRERIALIAGLASLGALLIYTGVLQSWDRLLYDIHQQHWSRVVSDRILLVAIDDRSIEAIGRWPWAPSVHAQLIDRLRESGAAAIDLNLIFSEPASSANREDSQLVGAIEAGGRVENRYSAGGRGDRPGDRLSNCAMPC